MGKRVYEVQVEAVVRVEVDDDQRGEFDASPLDPRRMEGIYSDMWSSNDLLRMLAYNAVANGRENAVHLDGWADLPRDAVRMDVREADCVGEPREVTDVSAGT